MASVTPAPAVCVDASADSLRTRAPLFELLVSYKPLALAESSRSRFLLRIGVTGSLVCLFWQRCGIQPALDAAGHQPGPFYLL